GTLLMNRCSEDESPMTPRGRVTATPAGTVLPDPEPLPAPPEAPAAEPAPEAPPLPEADDCCCWRRKRAGSLRLAVAMTSSCNRPRTERATVARSRRSRPA